MYKYCLTLGFEGATEKVVREFISHQKPTSNLSYAEKHGTQIGAALKSSADYHLLYSPIDPDQRQIHQLRKMPAEPALNAPSFAYEDMKVKQSSGGTSWYSNRNSKLSVPQPGGDSLNDNNKKTLNLRPRNSQQYNHSAIRHNPHNPLQTTFLNHNNPPSYSHTIDWTVPLLDLTRMTPSQQDYINPYTNHPKFDSQLTH